MRDDIISVQDFSAFYGQKVGVKDVTVSFPKNRITAIIGPSGCGKSTLLRSINRINDTIFGFRTEGRILFEGQDIFEKELDLTAYRKKVGMVFQKPTPFPMSIYDNVAFGPKIHRMRGKRSLGERVEEALVQASLWDEVKDELSKPATSLSGGQQQRLCIARALAVDPEVILLDEPTSALDPIATQNIEILLEELSEKYTILIVTHNLAQAVRISDFMVFMYRGELVETGPTARIVKQPEQSLTENYLMGKIS
ncbi:MAG TPA: phosphate ABC transporter ATP-binding protein PstB [Thermotogota bacterium]|nr:phosphate ABC transporter ATP-binding protein PstB [Thermotogota bacterium]HRW92787.1 phosphate ABC transporter ATP-binding protein PstB [Thermotogota bacterium]